MPSWYFPLWRTQKRIFTQFDFLLWKTFLWNSEKMIRNFLRCLRVSSRESSKFWTTGIRMWVRSFSWQSHFINDEIFPEASTTENFNSPTFMKIKVLRQLKLDCWEMFSFLFAHEERDGKELLKIRDGGRKMDFCDSSRARLGTERFMTKNFLFFINFRVSFWALYVELSY